MNALRLSGAAMVVTVLFAAAAGIASCGPGSDVYTCSIPTPGEVGADGGPDPCHCNIPDGISCQCTTPGDGAFLYNQCLTSLAALGDAGDAEGGP